ncbi:NAD-dependent epimerase/dehydratase family protein [Chryseobacterium populi]|uniref:Nucleoside-diphosphate-sugar epimerase n=1 Tax=Chryseobacterium populi TaxID=1144316 RepID=J2T1H8_9FLAO|nr:NAD-dependent epimerase/dehydratase family protein [Chryseobacterium populi]EJL71832.1 nucleoside-diphosphate-sugar epimerase [Chryseobacterium populi]
MKKIFVTGITGLLGANVVIKLLKDDYFVIALVRKKNGYLGEENEHLRLIEGDLLSDFSSHLKEVDCVIHIAAETRQNLLSYDDYKKINYEASIQLFSQAVSSGVRKFLFVSTANTLGFGSMKEPGNESMPQQYPFTQSFYARTKLETENYLLQNNKTTEVTILNPTFMIGPFDYKPSSGKIIFWVWKKKFVFYPKGGKNFVHVEDAANGIINAMEKGKNGEKYLLANENLTYKQFFKKVNEITGQSPVLIPIPGFGLVLLGWVGDFLRVLKIKSGMSSVNMKALRIENFYSNRKSMNELDVQYKPIEKAIQDAVDFFENR